MVHLSEAGYLNIHVPERRSEIQPYDIQILLRIINALSDFSNVVIALGLQDEYPSAQSENGFDYLYRLDDLSKIIGEHKFPMQFALLRLWSNGIITRYYSYRREKNYSDTWDFSQGYDSSSGGRHRDVTRKKISAEYGIHYQFYPRGETRRRLLASGISVKI